MEQPKEQNYLHGAAILTFGVIIMKILGAIYKIPLGNILDDDGYAYFYASYSVYNVFLTLATAGLPVALSRMIAEAYEQGRPLQARRTYRVAWVTFLIIGTISALIMFLFPRELAEFLGRKEAAKSIYAMSPGILFVCVMSAYRGYCQGHKNMTPTTIGQVLEVLAKVAVGLILALIVVNRGASMEDACAGAVFGVTVGGFVALMYMVVYKKRHYSNEVAANPDKPDSPWKILKNLLIIGIPITIGASGMSLMSFIDTKFVNDRLQDAAGFSGFDSAVLFGVFGKAQTLYNLPAAFVTPLVISIVPAIAAYMARGDSRSAGRIAEDSLRITLDIAMPMGIGLAVLSYPIMSVVYPGSHESGPVLLAMMGLASFFVCFTLVQNAILQAHGNEKLTIISILVGGVIKVAVDWYLVAIPEINIYGAPIGTILCYFVMAAMNFCFIRSRYEYKPKLSKIVIKPLISSVLMGVSAWGVYELVMMAMGEATRMRMALGMAAAIVVAVVVYVLAVVKTGAITARDMKLIPKGEKIGRLLGMDMEAADD